MTPEENKIKKLETEIEQLKQEIESLRTTRFPDKINSVSELLKFIYDSAQFGIGIADPDMNIIYLNNYFLDLLGYKMDELIGKNVSTFHDSETLAFMNKSREEMADSGKSFARQVPHLKKNGEIVQMLLKPVIFKNNEGEIIYYATTALDLTELLELNNQLEEREIHFRSIFENSNFAIAFTDNNLKIQFVNDAFISLFGYTIEEMKKIGIKGISHPDDFEEDIKFLRKIRSEESSKYSLEKRYIRKNGEVFWGKITVSLVRDKEGRMSNILGIIEDIGERKRKEKYIHSLNDRLLMALSLSNMIIWEIDLIRGKVSQYLSSNNQINDNFHLNSSVKSLLRGIHEEDKNKVYDSIRLIIDKHQILNEEYRFTFPTGETHWLQSFARPVEIQEGVVSRILGASWIITDRKETELFLQMSQEKYSSIVENSRDCIVRFDRDRRHIFANHSALENLDLKLENILGQRIDSAGFSEKTVDLMNNKIDELFTTRESQQLIFECDLNDCRKVFDWRIHPEYDENKEIKSILAVSRDITKQKEYENNLKESRENEALMHSIVSEFLMHSDEKVYDAVQDILLEKFDCKYGLFGFIDDDGNLVLPTLSTEIWDVCRVEDKKITFEPKQWGGLWGRSLNEKKVLVQNSGLKVPIGHIRLKNAISVPIIFKDDVIGLLLLADKYCDFDDTDVLRMKEIAEYIAPVLSARLDTETLSRQRDLAEQEIQKMNVELEQKVINRTIELKETNQRLEFALEKEKNLNSMKSQFINMVSHEYRTPLTVIMSSAHLIDKFIENDKIDKIGNHTLKIKRSVDNMISLIEDVVNVGKSTDKKLKTNLIDINILAELEDLINELKSANHKNHNFIIDAEDIKFRTDRKLFKLICYNIISNSIKYSPEKTTIELKAICDSEGLVITFIDQGIGFTDEDMKNLYEPFYRNKNHIGTIPGTGLGMTIIQQSVEALNGNFAINSAPGQGTKILLMLPAVK